MTPYATIRRDLIALRTKHGTDSPIGHRCSSLVEMIPNFEAATDAVQRSNLAAGIKRQMGELQKLTAQFN